MQHSEKAMLEGVAPVTGENGVVEQVLLFTCNIGTDDSCRATCINKHQKACALTNKKIPIYEGCRKSRQSALRAKPQQPTESLKVKDPMYDDSLSLE